MFLSCYGVSGVDFALSPFSVVWMVEVAVQVPPSIFSAFWDRQTSIPPELQALSNPVTNPEPAPQVLSKAPLLT